VRLVVQASWGRAILAVAVRVDEWVVGCKPVGVVELDGRRVKAAGISDTYYGLPLTPLLHLYRCQGCNGTYSYDWHLDVALGLSEVGVAVPVLLPA